MSKMLSLRAQGVDRQLVGVRIDADLVRVALADHQVAARAGAAVHEGMAELPAGREADIVARAQLVALLAQQQRHLAVEDQRMLLFQHMIVQGRQALAGCGRLDQHADLVLRADGSVGEVPGPAAEPCRPALVSSHGTASVEMGGFGGAGASGPSSAVSGGTASRRRDRCPRRPSSRAAPPDHRSRAAPATRTSTLLESV